MTAHVLFLIQQLMKQAHCRNERTGLQHQGHTVQQQMSVSRLVNRVRGSQSTGDGRPVRVMSIAQKRLNNLSWWGHAVLRQPSTSKASWEADGMIMECV